MITKEGTLRMLLVSAIALIDREYARIRLKLIREGLDGAPFDTAENLLNLEDDRERLTRELTERYEERIKDIRRGVYHDDWDDCYSAATEIKMLGDEGSHYKQSIATIVESGLPLLGKAHLLSCRGRMTLKQVKAILGELPPGWSEDEDDEDDEDGEDDEADWTKEENWAKAQPRLRTPGRSDDEDGETGGVPKE